MEKLLFPLFITWSITSKCNLRCKHCFRTEYDKEYLNQDKIKEIIHLFIEKGIQGIILTGGEPLMSKYIFNILDEIDGKIKVGIATNGILLTEKIIDKLSKYGVKYYQISLDGTNKETNDYIRGNGTYDKIMATIATLKEKECDITIAMTVNTYNYNDIKTNATNFIKKIGIKKLRIEYYIPINENDCEINKIKDNMMSDLCQNLIRENNNIKIQYPKFDDKVGCGAGIYNCVLNSDLSISPCDLLTHKYKTKQIDNIDDFEKLWNDDKCFLEWRENMKCYNCNKKYKCLAIGEVINE